MKRSTREVKDWLAGLGWMLTENARAPELRNRYQRDHSGRLRAAADWVSVVEAVRPDPRPLPSSG